MRYSLSAQRHGRKKQFSRVGKGKILKTSVVNGQTGNCTTPNASDPRTELVSDGLAKIPEAAPFLGVSASQVYNLMERGELTYVKIGRSRRIPRRSLIELAARNVVAR